MQKAPSIEDIHDWLAEKNSLGLFRSGNFSVKDIDPKPYSGHFNFLISMADKKLVLRFKGPEWGEPATGIDREYETLKAAEAYRAGPRVYGLIENFFGESALFEEYIEGTPIALPDDGIPVASFIASVNSIRLTGDVLEKQEKLFSYSIHKKTWRNRLAIILKNERTRAWGEKIKFLLPRLDKMLDSFEPLLSRALGREGPVFVFKSAHAGHIVKTDDGFRFFNWEKNGYGDPSFTLAVFLASIQNRTDFESIKKTTIEQYTKEKPVPHFQELVEQRLKEREVSNLLWVLWATAHEGSPEKLNNASVARRFKRVRLLSV